MILVGSTNDIGHISNEATILIISVRNHPYSTFSGEKP